MLDELKPLATSTINLSSFHLNYALSSSIYGILTLDMFLSLG